jgi:hypothetical protein
MFAAAMAFLGLFMTAVVGFIIACLAAIAVGMAALVGLVLFV